MLWLRFLLFGMLGLTAQIAFTALWDGARKGNWSLPGHASLWNLPLFGLIAFIFPPIAHQLGNVPWWGRGLVYAGAFLAMQLLCGWLLARINITPWKASGKFVIGGYADLSLVPAWFLAGLGVEWVFPWVKAMASI